jgi:hypothetical protein
MLAIDEMTLHRLLTCSSCKNIFDLPKVLPCGATVCSSCEDLTFNYPNTFKCPACHFPHDRPFGGFPVNISLKTLLDYAPDDAHRGTVYKNSKKCLNQLEWTMKRFSEKFVNSENLIRNYCDSLRNETEIMADSKIESLIKYRDEIVSEIDQYERGCLANIKDELNADAITLRKLISESETVFAKWSKYLKTTNIKQDDLTKSIDQVRSITQRFEDSGALLDGYIFNGSKLTLHNDEKKTIQKDHIYTLARKNVK